MSDEPKVVYKRDSYGADGHVIMEIHLYQARELTKNDERAIHTCADNLFQKLHTETALLDEKNIEFHHQWLRDARMLFHGAGLDTIYVEEIPNEYCGPECCPHKPWLIITTVLGHFKVGWRKRVLVLDWKRTIVRDFASKLFEGEDVTMEGQMIHCWNYTKADGYLRRILKRAKEGDGGTQV